MEFFANIGCDHVMVDWCREYVNPQQTKQEYAAIGAGIANSSNPNMLCVLAACVLLALAAYPQPPSALLGPGGVHML